MDSQKAYQPIDCNLYDYLEIACLHGYTVLLELRDGESVQGVATTTKTQADGEFILLDSQSEVRKIRLDRLLRLQVLSKPRSFEEVSFG